MLYNFSNYHFERAHGKSPRGRGWWLFEIGGSRKIVEVPGCHTLTEAKKLIAATLKEMGVPGGTTIYVAP